MNFDFEQIRDKQRILIIGDGTLEITKIASHVLKSIGKPFDFILADGTTSISGAPVVLIQVDDDSHAEDLKDRMLAVKHHIVVFHHIGESFPKEYGSFDAYFNQFELLADRTPKGGTIVYNAEDNLSMVVGTQKDREDVRLIEYQSVKCKTVNGGFLFENGVTINSTSKYFPSIAGAARELLNRMSVTRDQFYDAISSYNAA